MAAEAERKKLGRLTLIRRGHRGILTKLIKEIDALLEPAEPEIDQMKIISEQLEGKLKVFSNLDSDIVALCPEEDIEREIEDTESITAKIIGAKRKIDEALKKENSHTRSPVRPSVSGEAIAVKPRLPKLTLQKFCGDITTRSAFWDSYISAVHDNKGIAVVDKFNCLSSLLEGPAHRTIQGLTLNEDNYEAAVQLLQERFGKPKHIIYAHMEELIK